MSLKELEELLEHCRLLLIKSLGEIPKIEPLVECLPGTIKAFFNTL